MPVVVLGLSGAPNAGDELLVVENERKAREVALYRQGKFRDVKLARAATRAEDVFSPMGEAKAGIIPVLIKTDVQGSAEALRDALIKLSTDEVQVRVIASGVGGITASDIQLAAASKAFVIGFNVRADSAAREAMKETGVEVRYYSIIYEAIDDVKQKMSGLLAPEIKEQIVGVAQVREVFRSSKFGVVAGCLVTEGAVRRNNPIRVLRDNVVIFEGALESLRRFKDDVNEVRAGTECGIGVKNYQDVRVGRSDRVLLARRSVAHDPVSGRARMPHAQSHRQDVAHRGADAALARDAAAPRRQGPARWQRHGDGRGRGPDLSYARVHVLPFAGEHPAEQVLTGLRSAAGFLRGEVARELQTASRAAARVSARHRDLRAPST